MHGTSEKLHTAPDLTLFRPVLHGVGAYSATRGHDFPFHQHTHWELVFYRHGFIEAPIGEQVHRTRPGVLLLTPPYTMHAERAVTEYANYHAIIEAPPDHPWPRRVHDDAHGTFYSLFAALEREFHAELPDSAELIGLLVGQLDLLLQRALREQPPSEAELRVRDAELLWEEAPGCEWSIESTARRLATTPSQLRAHFAAVRGQSPSEVLRAIRVRHALGCLSHSKESLEVVARRCGFYSASHLSRHIKAVTGQTPGFWRQSKL